jgi:hypothetical protein
MEDNYSLVRFALENFIYCLYQTINPRYHAKLPKYDDFPSDVWNSEGTIDSKRLVAYAESSSNIFHKSIAYRIAGVIKLQNARDTEAKLDIHATWKLIYESLKILPKDAIPASIGSQGFLSIPLYRYNYNMNNFEYLRLHIWDKSLAGFIDLEKQKQFNIHSHAFHAQSWIITGRVTNNRYKVSFNPIGNENSLFEIRYDKTITRTNRHTSLAANTEIPVDLEHFEKNTFEIGDTYEIPIDEFHSSLTNEAELTATFFSFAAKYGMAKKSFVVGPSNISESEINRKQTYNAESLLNKINEKLKK